MSKKSENSQAYYDDAFLDFGPDSNLDARDYYPESDNFEKKDSEGDENYSDNQDSYDKYGYYTEDEYSNESSTSKKNTKSKSSQKSFGSKKMKATLAVILAGIAISVAAPIVSSTGVPTPEHIISHINYDAVNTEHFYYDDLPEFENVVIDAKNCGVNIYTSNSSRISGNLMPENINNVSYEVKDIDGVKTLVISASDSLEGTSVKNNDYSQYQDITLNLDASMSYGNLKINSEGNDISLYTDYAFDSLDLSTDCSVYLYNLSVNELNVENCIEFNCSHTTINNANINTGEGGLYMWDAIIENAIKGNCDGGNIVLELKEESTASSITLSAKDNYISLYTPLNENDLKISARAQNGYIKDGNDNYIDDAYKGGSGDTKVNLNCPNGRIYLNLNYALQ